MPTIDGMSRKMTSSVRFSEQVSPLMLISLSSIGFTFCERSPLDKVIDDFLIPANTDITVDWKRINIDAPVWSRTAETDGKGASASVDGYGFHPDRLSHISKADARQNVVGYGAGAARQCIGQHFASLLMRMVLHEVLARYRISAHVAPWDLGFRRDKFILTPNKHDLLFEPL